MLKKTKFHQFYYFEVIKITKDWEEELRIASTTWRLIFK